MGLAKTLYGTQQIPVQERGALFAIGKTPGYRYRPQNETPRGTRR